MNNKQQEYEKLMAQAAAQQQQPHPVDQYETTCGGLMPGKVLSMPKPWVELSIEEKIERTRDQVKSREDELRYVHGRMSELQREVGRLRSEMVDHRHDPCDGGRVMLPASCGIYGNEIGNCESTAPDVDPAKLYF